MDNKKINEDLINFWNESLKIPDEYKNQNVDEELDYKELAPSSKLLNALESLKGCNKVLDYGCGNGWASIALVKLGCQDVNAVDVGDNIIDSVHYYSKLCRIDKGINAQSVTIKWLSEEDESKYDGVVCNNVLDVVTLDVSKQIIKDLARVTTKEAIIVIGLNFYMSKEAAKSRGIELVEDKYLIMNDVLRLNSLSDDEWKDLFIPYFDIESLTYFSWPGEEKETRRLFVLKKKTDKSVYLVSFLKPETVKSVKISAISSFSPVA